MLLGPSAGSRAGRGIRYQDLVGALYVVQLWLGEYTRVVPEGRDDFELHTGAQIIIADAKSNHADARPKTTAEIESAFDTLRARPAAAQPVEYWVVAERMDAPAADGKTRFGDGEPPCFVVLEPAPLAAAIRLLGAHKGLSPLAARLLVLEFAKAAGDLASDNGRRPLDARIALTATDAEHLATRVLTALAPDRLEALVQTGFLAPVDFSTPLPDRGFYLGVDVQPGHFAAGLALPRTDAARAICAQFERRSAVALVGPSGAGKSGLMWNCALNLQAGRTWFRIDGGGLPDAAALTGFFRAYADLAPVGFVVDDIGRGRTEIWERLRALCAAAPNAVLIGSVRTEDAALLSHRHEIAEVQIGPDKDLAKAIWARLHAEKQTGWSGWVEPWAKSDDLLLEYGHILTQGDRLDKVVRDQIERRLTEKRDAELAILAASAPAAMHGGSVSRAAVGEHLGLSQGDMARALARLIEEHLVHLDASGTHLRGLHALRAQAICTALSAIGFADAPTLSRDALLLADPGSVESVARSVVATRALSFEDAGALLADRLEAASPLADVIAALRGVRAGGLTLAARDWLAATDTQQFPRKLATNLVLLGLIPAAETPDIGAMRALAAQGRKLIAAAAAQRPPPRLVDALISRLSQHNAVSAEVAAGALSVLAAAPLSQSQIDRLGQAAPDLVAAPLASVITALDAAQAANPAIARAWADSAPPGILLARLSAETPFAMMVERTEEDGEIILHSDLYETALGGRSSPNDLLAAHCHALLMLDPSADRGHARLIDAQDSKAPFLDAEKKIPRANSPPNAVSTRNRELINSVAREVGAASWSDYLARGRALLQRRIGAFVRLLDSALTGRINQQAFAMLDESSAETDALIAPFEAANMAKNGEPISGVHLTPLQNLLFELNANLISDIAKLPQNAPRLAMRVRSFSELAAKAKSEPWSLIMDAPPPALDAVQKLLADIEIVALEAASSNQGPLQSWTVSKAKDAFETIARQSRRAFAQRVESRRAAIESAAAVLLPGVRVIAPSLAAGVLWRANFAATFPLARFGDFLGWIAQARRLGDQIKTVLAEEEDLGLLPLLNGRGAADYAYQVSRSNVNSIPGQMLAAVGQVSLLGPIDADSLARLGVQLVHHPDLATRTFKALRDVTGMLARGFGAEDRPEEEQRVLEEALTFLNANGGAFIALFGGMDYPFVRSLRALADGQDVTRAPLPLDGLQEALAQLVWRLAHEPAGAAPDISPQAT